jgi:hypothetical protein
VSTTSTGTGGVLPESVQFFAALSGLFSKTLIERLKDGFKAFVGGRGSGS